MKESPERPFNQLPALPPRREFIETVKILRQLVKSSVALAELKGLAPTLPNPTKRLLKHQRNSLYSKNIGKKK